MELYHVKDNVFTFSKDVAVQANNFDNDTLTKLLNAAKDFLGMEKYQRSNLIN